MPTRQRLRVIKELSQIATLLGLLGAGVWAVWTFVFQYSVLPARLPAHLSVESKLEVLGSTSSAKLIAVRSTVQVQNDSNLRVCIIGSTFNMRAFRVAPSASRPLPRDVDLIKREDGDFVDLPQTVELSGGEIVNSGRLFSPNGTWLEAGQEQRMEFVTFIPEGYGLVRMRSDLRVSRSRDSDTEQCHSEKLSIEWNVARDGLVTMALDVTDEGRKEVYDYRRHKGMLKSYVPYHIIAFSYAAIDLKNESGG